MFSDPCLRDSMGTFGVMPTELVTLIVSLAAASCPQTAAKLSLVSRQVQSWSDPHIFRNIVFGDDSWSAEDLDEHFSLAIADDASPRLVRGRSYIRTFSSKQYEKSTGQFCKFISLCPNIFSIAFWDAELPLGITSLSIPTLRRMSFQETSGLSLQSPLFKTVTHLDLAGWKFSSLPTLGVRNMTSLTHLVLSSATIDVSHVEEEVLKGAAPSLRLLILRLYEDAPPLPAEDLRKLRKSLPCVLPLTAPEECEDEEGEGEKGEIEKEEVPWLASFDVSCDTAFEEWCREIPEEDSFWHKAEKLLENLRLEESK
ncbi:hypothetical protein DL96DRAFT_1820188 [Flagelloscypha sp. PMI_526]|nr:hypothetical protein DL96DRAFT_1820188 [Flagelloscypha sp. PMI_526]